MLSASQQLGSPDFRSGSRATFPNALAPTVAVPQIAADFTAPGKSAEAGKGGCALQRLISTAVRNKTGNTT
jgi:hypothetical protein